MPWIQITAIGVPCSDPYGGSKISCSALTACFESSKATDKRESEIPLHNLLNFILIIL
jgi:hypothetical protein